MSLFHHGSTLLLKVSSAPFLRDKQPHAGFMPRVDTRNELPSLVPRLVNTRTSIFHADGLTICTDINQGSSTSKAIMEKGKCAHNIRRQRTIDEEEQSRERVKRYEDSAADEQQRAERHAVCLPPHCSLWCTVVRAGEICMVKIKLTMSLK